MTPWRAMAGMMLALAGSAAVAEAASTRQLTLFTIGVRDVSDEAFVVGTDDPELIARARAELALPESERRLFPIGAVVAGHGGHNLGWSWHLDPDGWDLTETSIELCDGRPSNIEEHLESWLDEVGSYCPWGGFVLREGVVGPVADPARLRVALEPVLTGLEAPTSVTGAGDGSERLFITEKTGRIRIAIENQLLAEPFLDLTDRVGSTGGEQGLLGLAFHPRYRDTGWFYVNSTDRSGDTVVSRFSVSATDRDRADPGSELVLLTVEQPFANHNGGHLEFGPDGMLYVGLGDGGAAGDPGNRAQDPQSLLGKILRLDVDAAAGVGIPDDNPFVDDPAVRDEIWAQGLRNPWRFAFDRETGDLFIGDVGQNRFEEVDVEGARSPGGVNWGWRTMEGFDCFEASTCTTEGLSLPAAVYGHDEGCSVTGGIVYRGEEYPFLDGVYLFTDFCTGRIWALAPGGPDGWAVAEVGRTAFNVVAFGEDGAGEVWAVDLGSGALLRLTAEPTLPAPRQGTTRVSP